MDRLLTDEEIKNAVYDKPEQGAARWTKTVIPRDNKIAKAQDAKTIKWVIEKIDKSYLYLKLICLAAEDNGELARGYDLAMNEALSQLATLKAELGGENE